jgi:Pyridoxamine 5'-phosphate oxidase
MDLDALARDVLDRVRYVVPGTVDPDGRPRTSPVFFIPSPVRRYADLYWVSHPDCHHSTNLARDGRVAGVVFDSTVLPINSSAMYVDGLARE